MKIPIILPKGWPCTIAECPPGHFLYSASLCFMSKMSSEDEERTTYSRFGEVMDLDKSTLVQPVVIELEGEEV